MIQRLARYKDPDHVRRALMKALQLETCSFKFSAKDRWNRMPEFGRIMEIESFLVQACRDAMNLVPAMTPMQTVGTND